MPTKQKPRRVPAPPMPAERAQIIGEHVEDAELLRAALDMSEDTRPGKSGPMPAVVFAEQVALVNARTLRRYLAGTRPLPPLLKRECVQIIARAKTAHDRAKARKRAARAAS